MIQKIAALLFVCLLAPAFAFAQNYPEPASAGEPAVLCTGCPGNNAAGEANDGKPLYPYDVPLVDHVGRIVDSSTTQNVQHLGMRTLRADAVRIRPSRDRIYVQLGGTVAAYTLSTFFTSRLAQPLVGVQTIDTGSPYSRFGKPFERLARPDGHIYVESKHSGWTTSLRDVQLVLNDFDADDRGYVYVATIFGWGVHFDDGRTDGKHLPFVAQYTDESPTGAFVVKDGDQYYLVGGRGRDTLRVYDVTTPSTATLVANRTATGNGIGIWAKFEAGQRIAMTRGDGRLQIYTNAGLIAGSAPVAEYVLPSGRSFSGLSFDDDGNLWVNERGSTGGSLWKLAPVDSPSPSYVQTVYSASITPTSIHASAGYLVVGGLSADTGDAITTSALRLYEIVDGTPQFVDTEMFFRRHYHRAPAGYAQPNGTAPSYVTLTDVHLVAHNGLTYLIYNAQGLGDVYELGDVLRAPQLKINSISPAIGDPIGGTVVTINGRNFGQDSTVKFGNSVASTTFVDSFRLTAVAPKGTGSVELSVASGGQFATAPEPFVYALAAPQNFAARTTSTTAVTLTWTGTASAARYEVLRWNGSTFAAIGTATGVTFIDSGLTPGTAYVYRVQSMDADDNRSAPTPRDIAPTIQFTDASITPGLRIKAAHFMELRQAVNALRTAAGLTTTSFGSALTPGMIVRGQEVTFLRNGIRDAANFFGFTTPFTDSNLSGLQIKALHLQELRNILQ